MKSQIIVRMEFMATHKWPDASERRKYLADLHAHVFKFEGKAPVSHSNRQIEFHDLRARMHEAVARTANYRIEGMATFGDMSCEQIGEMVLKMVPELSSITVSEDGQFDAEVFREEDRPTVITLCGSTKFKDEFLMVQRKLEMDGYIVLSVGSFMHANEDSAVEDIKDELDTLHLRKIEMSDAVYIINPGGYIGESTQSEIEYARGLGKAVLSLEPMEYGIRRG